MFLSVEMIQCRTLHAQTPCTVHWQAWMEDHPQNDQVDMAAVYAGQTESEAEAEERLSGSDAEDGESPHPNSSYN